MDVIHIIHANRAILNIWWIVNWTERVSKSKVRRALWSLLHTTIWFGTRCISGISTWVIKLVCGENVAIHITEGTDINLVLPSNIKEWYTMAEFLFPSLPHRMEVQLDHSKGHLLNYKILKKTIVWIKGRIVAIHTTGG